jgi:hypothetical protein
MKLAIMQPYFFPYIGYWQLINAVDKFVILDDVNFIKQGFINRNRILSQQKIININVQVQGISSNKLILDHKLNNNQVWKRKLLNTVQQNYRKARQYDEVMPLIKEIITYNDLSLTGFLYNQIIKIKEYLNLNTEVVKTSTIYNITNKKGQERIIDICQKEKAKTYINAIGGKELYSPDEFLENGIELKFLKTGDIKYKQFNNEFVPNLSIIDVLMHNSVEKINEMLNSYTLE